MLAVVGFPWGPKKADQQIFSKKKKKTIIEEQITMQHVDEVLLCTVSMLGIQGKLTVKKEENDPQLSIVLVGEVRTITTTN